MSGYHRCKPAPTRLHLPLAILSCLALPGLVQAQDDSASTRTKTLEDVVVTAQKRSERLHDTPVAAAVVSQKALEDNNVSDISDLNKLVPSVELKGTFNGRVPIAMRGISTDADEATIGLTSGVSVMVDGVPVSSDAMGANMMEDLAQVEVLKGPQATLGGRAASAGVINLITRKPSFDWTGTISATTTNDGEHRGSFFVSGPLAENAAFSLSAYKNHLVYPIHNIATGKDSKTDSQGARLKLLFKPTDNLDVTLAAHGYKSDSRGGTFTYQYVTPGASIFSYIAGGIGYDQVLAGITPHWGNTDYNSPVDMRSLVTGHDFSVNVDYRLGDYTLSSTTAYQSEYQKMVQDVSIAATYWLNQLSDLYGLGLPSWDNTQNVLLKPSTRSQEFKIVSPLGGPVNFVAGVFYSDTQVWSDALRVMPVNAVDRTIASRTRTLDGYGRITWKLGHDMDLLTGARYNYDKVGYWQGDRQHGYASRNEASEGTWVGDVSLRKRFGEDAMAYLSYARGYKPMAFNTAQTLSSNGPLAPVDKEHINHYEAGLKLSLLDRALTLDTAVFQTTYNNYQVQIYEVQEGSIVTDLQLQNAGAARTRGLESDLNYAVSEALRLNASVAWIDAQYLRYNNAPCWNGQTEAQGCLTATDDSGNSVSYQNLAGKSLPDAPRFKGNLGVQYTWFAGNHLPFDVSLKGDYAWRSGAYMQPTHDPYTYQPAFGIFNLSLTGSWNSDRFSASLFVNNVFDKFYLVNVTDNFSSIWGSSTVAITGQPARDAKRYVGLRLNWNFD